MNRDTEIEKFAKEAVELMKADTFGALKDAVETVIDRQNSDRVDTMYWMIMIKAYEIEGNQT